MKKLLLLSAVGLVAASCSTTEYYQDDLAVAQRLEAQERQERTAPRQQAQQQPRQTQQQPATTRADFERQREVKEMQTKLSEIDQRISDIEETMRDMPPEERQQTAREVSDLRERQQRAESMLNEAGNGAPQEFVQVREELRDAVNELEVGVYRLLVREDAQPGPDEIIE